MKLLSKDQILGKDDRAYKDVEVAEWGGSIRLQAMSSAERDDYEAEAYLANKDGGAKAFKNLRARLVAKCAVDDDGELVFVSPADVRALGKQSAAIINRLFDVCRELNGLTQADVEELEGN